MGLGLAWLLGSTLASREAFLEETFDQTFLHVPAAARQQQQDALGISQDLREALELLEVHQMALQEDTSGLGERMKCSAVKGGEDDVMARYEGRLEEAYLDGCTIVCPLLSASWGPLAASVAALQEDFEGIAFSADLYLTPRGASGFRLHNDAQPSFILQVAGMKRWEVYNSSFPRPVREQTKAGDDAEALKMGPVVFAGELEPGDVLHIPHGFLHRAWTHLEGPSLHVSISPLTLPSVADILEQVVKGTPKDDIPDNARQFWDQVLEQAAKGEAAKAEGEWMRRSMPFAGRQGPMHRLANKRALPIFQAWVKKWREQLRIPLAGMLQVGKYEESFDLAFDTLLDDSAGALKKAFKGINKSFQISSQVCASTAQEFPRRRAAASEGLALLNLEGPHSQVSSVTPENWPFRPSLKLDKILEQMRQAGSWSSLQELLPTGSTPDDHMELSALMSALRRRLVLVSSYQGEKITTTTKTTTTTPTTTRTAATSISRGQK
ncbi:unnamed protein product [Polarella glacialis]|uniref:Bifunctional lysine-specific demethylase and histidyl-hydroxylase n=1 Tax=Polarella glacialis TaxID=89957 RepID=A0A813F8R9_POLGL|nr:unnamed protein product [Polarella glacialis]